jgi:hypothetical protein
MITGGKCNIKRKRYVVTIQKQIKMFPVLKKYISKNKTSVGWYHIKNYKVIDYIPSDETSYLIQLFSAGTVGLIEVVDINVPIETYCLEKSFRFYETRDKIFVFRSRKNSTYHQLNIQFIYAQVIENTRWVFLYPVVKEKESEPEQKKTTWILTERGLE